MMWMEDSDTPSTYNGRLQWVVFGPQLPLASLGHTFPDAFTAEGPGHDTGTTHVWSG